jgi:hypothetical protein
VGIPSNELEFDIHGAPVVRGRDDHPLDRKLEEGQFLVNGVPPVTKLGDPADPHILCPGLNLLQSLFNCILDLARRRAFEALNLLKVLA